MESSYPQLPVLVVDDEKHILSSVSVSLAIAGISNVVRCQDSQMVEQLLSQKSFSVITLDLYMPHISGQELLPFILQHHPDIPVIVVTGAHELEIAVDCMKQGAFDYLVKPVDKTRLVTCVKHAIAHWEISSENYLIKEHLLSDRLSNPDAFASIITKNSTMQTIFKYVEALAKTALPILITGETGVGKEQLAKVIHSVSGRPGDFVPVDIAGLDDSLFSDTLFGHRRGAFTGANAEREGIIAKAAKGTLFLDEIGDLASETQIKLLRLLQESEYYALGADQPRMTDARFIFATNQDLEAFSREARFRKDLYFRLHAHHIHVPPLRNRLEDISMLVDFFLGEAAGEMNRKKPTPPKQLYTLLGLYDFPGNIRELRGLVFDAVVRHETGILSLKHFENAVGGHISQDQEAASEATLSTSDDNLFASTRSLPTLRDSSKMLIGESLKRSDGNQTIAARILGITRSALNKRLKRSGGEEGQD